MIIRTIMTCDHCGDKFHNLDGSTWENIWWFCWGCYNICTGE